MTTYFFVAASEKFLTLEEPLDEILKERMRNYKENNKEVDFWLLKNPSFLQTTQFADLKAKIPSTPAVVLSTDKKFITFLKLRLEFVAVGEFEFPNAEIIDPFKVE
ncbi:MgPME-cyclase complex family protein [uncultured Prochlorococcus sp.]|uniref:MgPME-cyclase complex family protein n=1 Tax=uncultured Prochlorococcus sp. TaxID=159733 RepID=UPI0025890009|nr:MgPME-cyclase complex family protein [uncultured Prochlorococcus sp.]